MEMESQSLVAGAKARYGHAQLEDIQELLRKLLEDFQIIKEELAEYINSLSWNSPTFYDDDDDEYSIQVSEFLKKSPIAITPVLLIEEPDNSLSMGDEHLDTIIEMELDEVIKCSVEDLVLIPSESEGILDDMCDVPFIDKNHFDAEYDLIESLLTLDTLIVYSPKIDSFLEEFTGELVHIDPIPPGIDETNSNLKDDIRFIDYHTKETSSGSTTTHANNSLPEHDSFLFEIEPDQGELTSVVMNDIPDNSTNDPLMDEIDLFLASDNSIPLGIENVNYDSEGDILFLEELLRNDSLLLPEFESFHFDLYDDLSSPRPPEKPPDDGGV
nr:hypothetical protein [Tanacetum cinerariifolium]